MTVKIKRVYDPAQPEDGYRILVDRLWPRGLSKERAAVDLWLKEVAPSPALRTWFGHEPAKWEEFERRYGEELEELGEPLERVRALEEREGVVTLLYAAKDVEHTHARVLAGFLAK